MEERSTSCNLYSSLVQDGCVYCMSSFILQQLSPGCFSPLGKCDVTGVMWRHLDVNGKKMLALIKPSLFANKHMLHLIQCTFCFDYTLKRPFVKAVIVFIAVSKILVLKTSFTKQPFPKPSRKVFVFKTSVLKTTILRTKFRCEQNSKQKFAKLFISYILDLLNFDLWKNISVNLRNRICYPSEVLVRWHGD